MLPARRARCRGFIFVNVEDVESLEPALVAIENIYEFGDYAFYTPLERFDIEASG
jgi:hypothetical protein